MKQVKLLSKLIFAITLLSCLPLWAENLNSKIIGTATEDERVVGKLAEGLKAFYENGKMGFLNDRDEIILPATLDIPNAYLLPVFSEGLCLFYEKIESADENEQATYNQGFLNKQFQKVIPAIYPFDEFYCNNEQRGFKNGLAIVQSNKTIDSGGSSFIILDKTGNQVGLDFSFDHTMLAACNIFPIISEGIIISSGNSGEQYLDAVTGKPAINKVFDLAGPFVGSIAPVMLNNQYVTFINKQGNPIVNGKFYIRDMKPGAEFELYMLPSFLGGFVNQHLLLEFYENDGLGDKVFALINSRGEVLRKMKVENTDEFSNFRTKLEEEYGWKMGG